MSSGKKMSVIAAVLAGGTLVLGGLLSAGPATAASDKATVPPQACNYDLDSKRVDCFPLGTDVRKALEELHGKPVVSGVDAVEYKKNFDAAQERLKAADGGASTQSLTVVLGTIYDNLNYGGGSWSITANTSSGASCGGGDWTLNNLPGYGWGGRVSSMSASSGCLMTGWEGTTNYGASVSTWGNLGYVGDALNDKINSLSWYN